MGAPLGAGHGVHLVHDDRLDPAQRLARLRGEHQEQRLGRGDQDVRRGGAEPAAVGRAGVAGAQPDGDVGGGDAEPVGGVPDAGQRRPQVALDVDGERLERGDVEHPAALLLLRRGRGGEPVDRPQERRQRLAGAGRRDHQGVAAGRDGLPGADLGGGRLRERGLEPGARGLAEGGEHLLRTGLSSRHRTILPDGTDRAGSGRAGGWTRSARYCPRARKEARDGRCGPDPARLGARRRRARRHVLRPRPRQPQGPHPAGAAGRRAGAAGAGGPDRRRALARGPARGPGRQRLDAREPHPPAARRRPGQRPRPGLRAARTERLVGRPRRGRRPARRGRRPARRRRARAGRGGVPSRPRPARLPARAARRAGRRLGAGRTPGGRRAARTGPGPARHGADRRGAVRGGRGSPRSPSRPTPSTSARPGP